MERRPVLVVMLTYNDHTVKDAYEIFDRCKDSKAEYWGFKEEPLPIDEMKKLFDHMHACGKKTALEVVAYTEKECIQGAKMAVECGCDLLMGTVFFDSVNDYCKQNNMRYCPFVGELKDRPTVMSGDVEKMISDAKYYISKGAYGIDLLGYRYTGDAAKLIEKFISNVDAPVCVAGSINSYERLDEIKRIKPWSFTIGSGFFDKCFGDDFCEQINTVCDYMEK
ncbi:hypothetical protein [Ruminococcus sp. FC2018]|uniref:hypothetical protein n=1 Tax=Ruminococcus sp. FC2018 TaxID=1410617 RepID=UPI00048B57B1|nr:hypothetical protein [Ruminococcus sp. FC2018]